MYAITLLLFCFLISSCTTTKDVMPGENGINKVYLKSSDDEDGRTSAIAEAKKYCKDKHQEAIFLDQKTEYKGSMDESTRKLIKKASNAAIVAGGITQSGSWSRGDSSNDPGRVLGGAGTIGHVMTNDKDYVVNVQFKCE
jgi:hypothetical protein